MPGAASELRLPAQSYTIHQLSKSVVHLCSKSASLQMLQGLTILSVPSLLISGVLKGSRSKSKHLTGSLDRLTHSTAGAAALTLKANPPLSASLTALGHPTAVCLLKRHGLRERQISCLKQTGQISIQGFIAGSVMPRRLTPLHPVRAAVTLQVYCASPCMLCRC